MRQGLLYCGLAMLLTSCAPVQKAGLLDQEVIPAARETVSVVAIPEIEATLTTEILVQPLDHRHPKAGALRQQVLILRPKEASDGDPVFFMLGNETDSTPQRLQALYRSYGSPKRVTFITADHRGYGQSISDGDQSKPTYVTIDQALSDYDKLVRVYQRELKGKWLGGGCSYGGALAIMFAHRYPEHFSATIISSAPTIWNFTTPEYAPQVEANLGKDFADRMAAHMSGLKPLQPYDAIWVDRERLVALTSALSQLSELSQLSPVIARWSLLPTGAFLDKLKANLPPALMERIDDFAVRRIPGPGKTAEAFKTGQYNWYTWKYQQCHQTGTFFLGGVFPYTRAEHVADCKATFGEAPTLGDVGTWQVQKALGELSRPTLIVDGERDPWLHASPKPSRLSKTTEIISVPNALHCPDVYSPDVGQGIFQRALTLAGQE